MTWEIGLLGLIAALLALMFLRVDVAFGEAFQQRLTMSKQLVKLIETQDDLWRKLDALENTIALQPRD